MIIGITGTLGAGKTTIANYLKSKGFKHFSVREFVAQEAHRREMPITRDNLVTVANELRAAYGPEYILATLVRQANEQGGAAVIESIRAVGEAEALKRLGGYLLAINANPKLRYERAQLESNLMAPQTFEQFIAQEEREMFSDDPTKQNIAAVMLRADYQLLNNGTIKDLETQIDLALVQMSTLPQTKEPQKA